MIEFKVIRRPNTVEIGVVENEVIVPIAHMDATWESLDMRLQMAKLLVDGANQGQVEAMQKVSTYFGEDKPMSAFERYQQGPKLNEGGVPEVISSSAGRRPPLPTASDEEWAAYEKDNKDESVD